MDINTTCYGNKFCKITICETCPESVKGGCWKLFSKKVDVPFNWRPLFEVSDVDSILGTIEILQEKKNNIKKYKGYFKDNRSYELKLSNMNKQIRLLEEIQ